MEPPNQTQQNAQGALLGGRQALHFIVDGHPVMNQRTAHSESSQRSSLAGIQRRSEYEMLQTSDVRLFWRVVAAPFVLWFMCLLFPSERETDN